MGFKLGVNKIFINNNNTINNNNNIWTLKKKQGRSSHFYLESTNGHLEIYKNDLQTVSSYITEKN